MRVVSIAATLSIVALPVFAMGQLLGTTDAQSGRDSMRNQQPDTCGAAEFHGLLGRPGAEAEALQLDRPMRVIPLGAAVTMDFIEARINFELDGAGNVARIYCG